MMLEGKVAVVTGAGRGLGRAYAVALAAAGASVVVNDLDAEALDETVEIIEAAGGTVTGLVAAVGSAEVADKLVRTAVGVYGRLDVMVPNAGVLRDRTLTKLSDEDFDLVLETHLRGTFTCARAAVARFREQGTGGRLILIGSPAGQYASFGQTPYSAAKAGIVGMVRTLAAECGRMGVTVNAVIPTALTRMVATIPGLGELVTAVDAGEPVPPVARRAGLGSPDDVAGLVVFLASDLAADITGQAIGAGGDRLSVWCHPTEVVVASKEGGWSAQDIAEQANSLLRPHVQSYEGAPPPDLSGAAASVTEKEKVSA
ncbi:SDR family NAD(P)-dependent oxidoreductase [Streptomyces sp. NPDC096132]|uniref:SDR family NAD(P)-dependent oxidoreductase n=1 Tax=Streptomyces sp. NPDC096132 TaxID=3366075 RepID=UPI003824F88A